MTQLRWAALIAGILWALAALATLAKADGRVAPTLWYSGWAVIALFYAFMP